MLLEIAHAEVWYGHIRALQDVNLRLEEGRSIVLLGANGAGKSSILHTIAGVLKPRLGSVRFDGADISEWSVPARVRSGITLVPEGRRILVGMSVHENLLLGAQYRKDVLAVSSEIESLYERFPNLGRHRAQLAACLSGGEQQMLAIARGLMSRPRLLLLDEPSLGLSPLYVEELFKWLKMLKVSGLSILLVEQYADRALKFADYAYLLERGKVVAEGESAHIRNSEHLYEAYVGR